MKKILFVFVLTVVVLSACGTSGTTPVPTNPPAALPAETVPPAALDLSSKPTPGPLIFQDDFKGVLDSSWKWTRENNKNWSLSTNPGWLQIMAGSGSVSTSDIENLLMRKAPAGNFELETSLKFKPTENNQFAGLIIYESAKSYVQFGRAFCDTPKCTGDGYYMDLVSGGSPIPDNYVAKAGENDTVTLRLQREGNLFTAFVSENGADWKVIDRNNNSLLPAFVGLVAGHANNTTPIPAQFDYFVVNALP
jgi:beta-xylosidase